MDAIYAITTSSRPIVVRIDILKVENSSFKTLAYRALTDADANSSRWMHFINTNPILAGLLPTKADDCPPLRKGG